MIEILKMYNMLTLYIQDIWYAFRRLDLNTIKKLILVLKITLKFIFGFELF
jgi:hypothetical protein